MAPASQCWRFVRPLRGVLLRQRGYATDLTASKVLDQLHLKAGDVLIQNGAESETGRAVIHAAQQRGIKTINVIAEGPGLADAIEGLKLLGGDVVVPEGYAGTWCMRRLLSDLPRPSAALNCSQGSAAVTVARLLKEGGTLVTYGVTLPAELAYKGAQRRPVKWVEFLKARKIVAKAV